jgi:hypothetical protein
LEYGNFSGAERDQIIANGAFVPPAASWGLLLDEVIDFITLEWEIAYFGEAVNHVNKAQYTESVSVDIL